MQRKPAPPLTRTVGSMNMLRNIAIVFALAVGFSGCGTASVCRTADDPTAVRSPALLPNCGVPVARLRSDFMSGRLKTQEAPVALERPVVWVKPMRTESLYRVLPYVDCIRITRPCDRFWHWTDHDTVVITDKGSELLDNDEDVVRFLNMHGGSFWSKSQDNAQLMLFAFAELSGYQIVTEAPDVPDWINGHQEKQKQADALDWSLSWKKQLTGWEVSCVLVKTPENMSSYRYTILVKEYGGIQIKRRTDHFHSHLIF